MLEKSNIEAPISQPPKTIFKTKTFFRSRHSRSQDVIGKYVAEQLNAAERMDIESEINGSDAVSSPEARESPPVEQVRVARLAPKIQLKKMKAEAQLREKEKHNQETSEDNSVLSKTDEKVTGLHSDPDNKQNVTDAFQDVLYPTQEIKPINKDISEKILVKEKDKLQDLIKTDIDSDKNIDSTENKSDYKPVIKFPGTSLENCTEKSTSTYMSESTASAVDALLSVSRDADRVTKIISNDPPEDLFEDDNKEAIINNNINGFNENINKENGLHYVKSSTDDVNNPQVDPELLDKFDTKEVTQNLKIDISNQVRLEDAASLLKPDPSSHEDDITSESVPSESVLQIAEALISLPATAIQNKISIDFQEPIQQLDNETELITETAPEQLPEDDIDQKVKETEEKMLVDDDLVKENMQSTSELDIVDQPDFSNTVQEQVELSVMDSGVDFNGENEQLLDKSNSQETNQFEVVEECTEEIVAPMVEDEIEYIEDKNKEDVTKVAPESLLLPNRFETEQEKSENLNAAQSLVQMSESIDHSMNIIETSTVTDTIPSPEEFTAKSNSIESSNTVEQKIASMSSDNSSDISQVKPHKFETSSSKLLKILEEPCVPKVAAKASPAKHVIIPGTEKILNFDVAKASIKSKPQKQKIIIRRTVPNKTLLNNLSEVSTPDKIILSRSNKPQDGSGVQTYTIQATPEVTNDGNTIIIQQKLRKIAKPPKLQKIKDRPSLSSVPQNKSNVESTSTDDSIFDINSMPVVLSDDLLTPESIEKMPIVMSDGNLITNQTNPPKLIKTKQTVNETEKVTRTIVPNKPELKTLLMNPVSESNKVSTPNILSKSSKIRSGKPMLVIDKTTGKQKIIMTKAEPTPVKEIKQQQTLLQPVTQNTGKTEKFIIVPTGGSPRPGRTQKIVIDPQTGKAHILVSGPDPASSISENKQQVSAKLVPSSTDSSAPGNTVMIITNAQGGTQSRIILTPEHEKILFPNKQQPNVSQLKAITQRITSATATTQKTLVTSGPAIKTQTRIVPKQKSAIITSKGQLIVGGRVATSAQNIAPMPEIRPATKRLITSEPKKIVQTIQKTSNEPLIFLQQKSGAVMQLTTAQFEHLQRTGQIVQKSPSPAQETKVLIQKSITVPATESVITNVHKQRVRKTVTSSPTPIKKAKQEIAIAPAPPPTPMPALTPLSNSAITSLVPSASSTVAITSTTTFQPLDNFEELLPSTAIARPTEPVVTQPQPEPSVAPAPAAPLSDGQLLAVPGEHFGGPPGSFYLCVEDNGTLTPIDNRPLVLENNQLVPMAVEPLPVLGAQPERRDILEAALANSDVFHADTPRDDGPDFRDLNANVSVHCRVSETSTTLNQPIMTPVEVPTKGDGEPAVPANLEDGLAVIGVTPHTVPTSLELPITVTDPRIAPKTTDPLSSNNYGTTLLTSPNTEMTFASTDETGVVVGGPISMPLLTDEESVGKSMPILTDDITERTVSSVESTIGSPSSIEVRESEVEDGGQWSRRLLTPGSDTSETSSEIPLQPVIQLAVNDFSRKS